MGAYLNSQTPYTLYQSESRSPYFVDKTMLLQELFPYVAAGNRHLCVTRPRRFGKTIAANMISSFFQKGIDSGELFDRLKISEADDCQKYKNKYNVIRIDFSKMPRNCESYRQYIERVEELLISDLREAYPDAKTSETDAIGDILEEIFQQYHGEKFIFVLDEWDFIFHRGFITEADKAKYVAFLSNLLKDRPYVILSYMTGILPIAKYSSGSELNMFAEFTMVNSPMFGTYFGFTDDEVDDLYERYCRECEKQRKIKNVTRKGLRDWYNGYYTKSGERVYNPRSVVFALQFNNLANYWTSSGPYDEIYYYIRNNVSDVRDDLALMAAGESVSAKIQEYAATSMNLSTRDEIYSAMVVYGFLSYLNGKVSIPNRELMEKFDELLMKIKAELAEIENDLAARDSYRVEREDKAGVGYVDFIFYPYDLTADGIILELKVDHTPEEAIQQIKDRKYALKFVPRLAEQKKYTGKILAVGIGYEKTEKKHRCRVESLN